MASRKVSVLKFVGTISIGLLTGVSYSLSTLTIPSLLELPSASSAAKAFRSLATTAAVPLNALASVSTGAFLLAFALSPRGYRHPYLLYTSLFVMGTGLTHYVAPSIFGISESPSPEVSARRAAIKKRKEADARRRMEASYELLGTSDSQSDADSASAGPEETEEDINGEEVRSEVEFFVKNQLLQTALTGIGFMMAVVGIWGDGVMGSYNTETLIIELP